MTCSIPSSHLAVRLHGLKLVKLERIETPKIQDADDAIVKISLCGLCGSDLHPYRGLEPFQEPYVCGHEFVGEVVALGEAFSGRPQRIPRPGLYQTLKVGDKVFSPFTVSCQECEYCKAGFSSRCRYSQLFGSESLPGAQSQYVRVPKAGGTLLRVADHPRIAKLPDSLLLLLADILPTGFYAVLRLLKSQDLMAWWKEGKTVRLAVVGLGPVGLCALLSLLGFILLTSTPAHMHLEILAIDPNASRRDKAAMIVEELDLKLDSGSVKVVALDPSAALASATSGCGPVHAVCEMVGNDAALQLSYDILRPFGLISSIGVHTSTRLPLSGGQLYDKNVTMSFGRCPVRSVLSPPVECYPGVVDVLLNWPKVFETHIANQIIPLTQAVQAYDEFDRGVVGKLIFKP